MNEYYDAIIVGTGAAGLYCALNLPKRKKILMLTKQGADLSDSFLAQGGICMLRGEDDYEDYFEDTMRDLQVRSIPSAISGTDNEMMVSYRSTHLSLKPKEHDLNAEKRIANVRFTV